MMNNTYKEIHRSQTTWFANDLQPIKEQHFIESALLTEQETFSCFWNDLMVRISSPWLKKLCNLGSRRPLKAAKNNAPDRTGGKQAKTLIFWETVKKGPLVEHPKEIKRVVYNSCILYIFYHMLHARRYITQAIEEVAQCLRTGGRFFIHRG